MSADKYGGAGRGMSVEATVSVSISCTQDEKRIRGGIRAAGDLAEEEADRAIATMDEYLFSFMEDSK